MRRLGAVLLVALASLCGVGCLATLEPLEADTRWAWRLGYGGGAVVALVAAARLLRS